MEIKIVVFRHGLAGDRLTFQQLNQLVKKSDDERPLTTEGIKETKKVASNLKNIIGRVDVIATSPLTRARQTADILNKKLASDCMIEIEELRPRVAPERLLSAVRKMSRSSVIVLVGHEPQLSRFISFALTGTTRSIFDIKKSGFAILEFSGRVEKKQAVLKCFLQPRQMRKIRQ